jgi:hypothetical protein
VRPNQPEVVWFDWQVPPNASRHSCIMVIVESREDKLPNDVRLQNIVDATALVKENRHIGLRNLHIVPLVRPPMRDTSLYHVAMRDTIPGPDPQDLLISRAGLMRQDTLDLLLPSLTGLTLVNVVARAAHLTAAERAAAIQLGVDTTRVYRVNHPGGSIKGVTLPTGVSQVGLRYRPFTAVFTRGARRFVTVAMRGTTVLGGSTFIIRPK